jgi:predicted nucleotidyltransferase
MMVAVYRALDAPIELHIVTEDKFKSWYLRFIDKEEIIEIL